MVLIISSNEDITTTKVIRELSAMEKNGTLRPEN